MTLRHIAAALLAAVLHTHRPPQLQAPPVPGEAAELRRRLRLLSNQVARDNVTIMDLRARLEGGRRG